MKLLIQAQPGDTRTPYKRFEDLAKQVFAAPKEEVDKRRAEYERKKKKKKPKGDGQRDLAPEKRDKRNDTV
jgi:hypothetical protein